MGFREGGKESSQEGKWRSGEGDGGCGLWVTLLRFVTPSHIGN